MWLGIALLLLLGLGRDLNSGFNLNSNILDLLPGAQHSPIVTKSSKEFTNRIGRQVIILVGNKDKNIAQAAADSFFKNIKTKQLFEDFNYKIDGNQQQAWGSFYFPYRLSLLTPAQKKLLQQNKIAQLKTLAISQLYSPLGITNSELLKTDPWFLFQNYVMALPKPASNIELQQQHMMVQANGIWYVLINATLQSDSFAIANQNAVVEFLQKNKTQTLSQFANTKILMTGMVFYAKAGTDQAQHDVSIIGIGSLIGIILLVLLTFRSISPLLFILMSCLFGIISAFVVTQLVFGSVYLFTLVFGASLIGISVDYAFFYYADQLWGGAKWTAEKGLKNIFPGVSFGLLNVVIAFLILAVMPFPGLRQLALFAISGLTMAYLTVIGLFPLLLKPKRYNFMPLILRLSNYYLNLWRNISVKKVTVIYILIFLFGITGIFKLKANDNIRILESTPKVLRQTENNIKGIIGSKFGMNFYVITGNTPAQTLFNEEDLTAKIDQNFPDIANKYLAVSEFLPSAISQQQNFKLIKTKLINNNLMAYLNQIGINKVAAIKIQSKLSAIKFQPLTIKTWLLSPVSKAMRYLWLGKINDKYATILLLSNQLNATQLQAIARTLPAVTYINQGDDISKVFKFYRRNISWLLGAVYLILLSLLMLKYSPKIGSKYFLVPLGSGLLSLGFLGFIGTPLTLFNLLALLLVLGISMDYILFFAETRSSYNSTMLAVTLAAVSTILSFGLLAFSGTPVIHYFGLTVFVGILSSMLLAPIGVKFEHHRK